MLKEAYTKFIEALISVIPISIIILLIFGLQYSDMMPSDIIPVSTLLIFFISLIALILGMMLFSLGSEISMSKVGKYIGSSVTKMKSIVFMIVISFLLGFMITLAEPDLTVLGDLLEKTVNPRLLKSVIGLGVGVFLVIGLLRIIFQKSLKLWLIFFYAIVFGLAAIFDGKSGDTIVSIAFDSGGVTTGPVTVPFLLTFGAGVAATRGGKDSGTDSFGVMGICSAGPLISTMLLFMILSNFFDFSVVKNSVNFDPVFGDVLATTTLEVFIALVPIMTFFFIYQTIFIRLPKRELIRIFLGLLYTFIGLSMFLISAKFGLIPIAHNLGSMLSDPIYNGKYDYLIILLAIVIGFAVVLVEPGVHVLNGQVEEISGGAIKKKKMLISLCFGVALAIILATIRELAGNFSILYYFVPLYIIALFLTFTVPDIYSAVAFDSGGVASGTMSSCFVLPFLLGIAASKGESSGFGVIGLISVMPIITVQMLGLETTIKSKVKLKVNRSRFTSVDDLQIIHF